ncbi:MAG: hypothetical protein NT007_12060 [Candidatus Kapabacteria bacterium]|nr:hypothetical protein [Candidatus Kapabacteria bacterium]
MVLLSLTRNYIMSDADLCMFASNLISFLTRDLTEFEAFGVNAGAISDFEDIGNAFARLPTDNWYLGNTAIATEDKKVKADELRLALRAISLRAENKWGVNSARCKQLGVVGMNRFNDRDLLVNARNVHYIATQYLTDLASEGLTAPMLTALETLASEFESTMNAQSDAIVVRGIKSEERIIKGNELYALVTKYCNIGKMIWENSDPAKFADYLRYPTVNSRLSKPQNVRANWTLGDLAVTLNWEVVAGAATYDVYTCSVDFGLPSGTFSLLAEYVNPPQGVAFVVDKRNYYKLKAKNSSLVSDYSEEAWTEVVKSI